jgi:MarR family transcriptional regulator for hemolysin
MYSTERPSHPVRLFQSCGIYRGSDVTEHADDIDRDLFDLISALARMMRTRLDQRARGHHLTYAQCVTLKWMRDQPGARQSDIASAHKQEPITISRQVDRLEWFGLIERRHDAKDRRVRRLHVLPKGDRLLALLEDWWDQLDDFVIGDLSTNECENLKGVLLYMKNRLVDPRICGAANEARNS